MPKRSLPWVLAFALLAGTLHAADFIARPEVHAPSAVRISEPQTLTLTSPIPSQVLVVPEPATLSPAAPEIAPTAAPAQNPGPAGLSIAPGSGPSATLADPGRQEARLDQIFDRRGPALPSTEGLPDGPAFVSDRVRLMGEVRALAAPWRTETQLEKLKNVPRADGETFRFNVIGDAEPGRFAIWRVLFGAPGVFVRLLSAAEKRASDFTVQLGDMVSRGTLRNFIEFFKTLIGVNPQKPYLTVIGNHDRRKPHGVTDNRLYRSLFGKTDYFFEHAGVRFVTVDSSAGRLTEEQVEWLDRALDTPKRKIVFTHMAPSVVRPWGTDGADKTWGGFKDGAEEFADIVSRRGVERVYVGHIHGLRLKDYRGVRYVITGGGGSPLFPGGVRNNFHHSLTVEVGPDGIRETVHRADGTSYSLP